jgi:HAMP domain-containing protein
MSITGKMRLGLGILLAFLATQFIVGQLLERNTRERVDAAISKNFTAAEALAELGTQAQALRRYEKEFFIYVNDPVGRTKYRREWTSAYAGVSESLAAMAANKAATFGVDDLVEFDRWSAANQFYGTEFTRIMSLADAGTLVAPQPVVEEPAKATKGTVAPSIPATANVPPAVVSAINVANEQIGPGKDKFRELLDGAQKMRKAKIAESRKSVDEINGLFDEAAKITLGVFALGLVAAIYLMMSLPKSVTQPIAMFVGVADRISKGDVSQSVEGKVTPEFHGLSTALERLRVAQTGLLDRIRVKSIAARG